MRLVILATALVLVGCAATTTVTLEPSDQPPVCDAAPTAGPVAVLWGTRWRPDQKDIPEREAAATAGMGQFLARSGCFPRLDVQRIDATTPATIESVVRTAAPGHSRTVVIVVRELGPLVKLLGSAALVEGGTEVVLDVAEYRGTNAAPARTYTATWRNGGPGVIKGVASLPADMEAALGGALGGR